jgi:shikimate dehydrogenase
MEDFFYLFMKKFGLIGYPLEHSFSKFYFTEKFKKEGIQATYENFSLSNIDNLKTILSQNKVDGFNVTIPHKESIIHLLDDIDSEAKIVGAVNCVKISNNQLIGYNTDIIGFEKSFLPFISAIQSRKKALVFGTGGANKAVVYILKKHQIPFLQVSRNEILYGITYTDIDEKIMQEYSILINTTPVGMYPKVEEVLPIPYHLITDKHFVFDLVYNPEKSKLLLIAENQGAQIKNGLDMLHIQAEEAWKIFGNM